jgi:hypothetical protein
VGVCFQCPQVSDFSLSLSRHRSKCGALASTGPGLCIPRTCAGQSNAQIFRIRRTKYFRSQIFCMRLRTDQLTTGCAQNRLANTPCTLRRDRSGNGQGVVHEPDRPWPIKSKRFCISRSSCVLVPTPVCVCADVCQLPAPTQNWLRAVFTTICAIRYCPI